MCVHRWAFRPQRVKGCYLKRPKCKPLGNFVLQIKFLLISNYWELWKLGIDRTRQRRRRKQQSLMRWRSCQAAKYLIIRENSAAGREKNEREEEKCQRVRWIIHLHCYHGKNDDDEDIPVFKKLNRKSWRLFLDRLFKFPPGLLRPFLDTCNADFKDIDMYHWESNLPPRGTFLCPRSHLLCPRVSLEAKGHLFVPWGHTFSSKSRNSEHIVSHYLKILNNFSFFIWFQSLVY